MTLQRINNGNHFHFWLNFLPLRPTPLECMFDLRSVNSAFVWHRLTTIGGVVTEGIFSLSTERPTFATKSGCCTSINTWQRCPSAVTQSTTSPLELMKLCQCGRASVVEQSRLFPPSSNLLISFFFSSSVYLSQPLPASSSYCRFTDVDADPSHSRLSFTVSLNLLAEPLFLSPSSRRHLSLFLASAWLWGANKAIGCLLPFLLFFFPQLLFWHYSWLKVIVRRLYLHSPHLIRLWRNIWGGGEDAENKIAY